MVTARWAPACAASVVVVLVVATKPLAAGARYVAFGAALLSWIAALAFARRDVRTHASAVLAIAAVVAAGQVDGGALYGVATALFLATTVASMHAVRGGPWIPRPSARVGVVLTVGTLGLASALVTSLPRLARAVEKRINAFFESALDETTAFSTTMALGATRGMLVSDAVVLHIDGEAPEYLRGAVYDRYQGRYWVTSAVGRERRRVAAGRGDATRITLVRGAPNGDDMRWFLPPGACDFSIAVDVDGFGVARRARMPEPATITFKTHGCTTSIAPPTSNDVDVPPDVAARLAPIAARWTDAEASARGKLEAIRRELSRFTYSLAVDRAPGVDPIVDFLTIHQAGHCELFASAMVLLARTQGIPARVVGGYPVTEQNPLTGRMVVRDRNAHAWAEAWVDGAWRAWDPTPTSETFARGTGLYDHVTDALRSLVERVTLRDLGVFAGAVAGVSWLVRWRRGRRRVVHVTTRPLPCFEELVAALAEAGHVWDPYEPIESFAARIRSLATPWADVAARALAVYAELRYGGLGDESGVAATARRAVAEVRRR